MVEYSEETTSDAVVKASSQNQEEQFNDFEDEREEQNLFPSRKIAKLLREKIFLVLRVGWRQFELYGWYFLFALLVYVTFKRHIRGFCRTLWSRTAGRLLERTTKGKSSISEKDREKQLERARRKQEEEWEKASKEKLTSKTNADKRIEAVEKKASRLGVAKHRKGHVLGRE
jgi:hypothetical protein